jgi:hypothetical protein
VPSGGARARSGPRPKEGSGRSEKRGYRLDALPAEGFNGPAPAFPLPDPSDRELEIWEQTWRLPQGAAWSLPGQAWRHWWVAMYVRQAAKCEDPEVAATQLAQLHRFADHAGLTDNGMAAMGWKVQQRPHHDELDASSLPPTSSRYRLRGLEVSA